MPQRRSRFCSALKVVTVRQAWQVSIRRACDVLKAERSSYHYKSRRGDQADLKKRIKEIAEARVRYGYRRSPRKRTSRACYGRQAVSTGYDDRWRIVEKQPLAGQSLIVRELGTDAKLKG